ncbi:MAG: tetratricopeptide repeat protein [Phycisphaerae bacterium]|nr:tetratricopeptide repeat protein [Phycisphaerae bacterium]
MSEENPELMKRKALAFFDRADEVAETGNWDFAIEMYIEGIRRDPENLQRGHHKLREVALNRKAAGGKAPGWGEKSKHKPVKDNPVESLANAEFLLAKDWGNEQYLEKALLAAVQAAQGQVARWLGEQLIAVEREAKKPNKRVCVSGMDALMEAEQFDLALEMCRMAVQAAPDDSELQQKEARLSAQYTIMKGRYGEEGKDFTDSVKDMGYQTELMEKDATVKSKDYLQAQIEKAKAQYLESPDVPGKINAYVDALLKPEDDACENEAIEVLRKAYAETKAYAYKMRIGDIKSKQYGRRFRQLKAQGQTDKALKVAKEQLAFEIKEYQERAQNYPTDYGIKYELGRRLFMAGRYDDAIGALQQAQHNPRRRVNAANYLGQAFMKKEWWQEAIDTLTKLVESDLNEDRLKEIRYNLGECYEQLGELHKAEEQFSMLAQTDFNYKDVRDRLQQVRDKIKAAGTQSP